MNQMLPASPAKKKVRLTDGKIIEPKEKLVICAVNMYRDPNDDKVNFYTYDKDKFKHEAETWPDLSYENKKWSGRDCADMKPIASINFSHYRAGYITFGSHLFRIGGRCVGHLGYDEYPKTLADELIARIQGTRKVDIIDLSSEGMVATKGPRLNCPRADPHLLILRGNLYVASGLNYHMTPDASAKDMIFMEVLKKPTAAIADWSWEPLPNPPPFCVESDRVADLPINQDVIIGAVESIGVIIVGLFNIKKCSFYTYQPLDSTWVSCTHYPNISLHSHLHFICRRTAVVSNEFMLWIWCSTDIHFSTLLYVMDLANDELITIDLFENKVLPHINVLTNYGCPPTLLKLEDGEFCVLWIQLDDPDYTSGRDKYNALHASTFTLERVSDGKLNVKQKEHYISLIPYVRTHPLDGLCIADVPDSKRCNDGWNTFC